MNNISIGTRILLIISAVIFLLILSLAFISRSYLSKSYNTEIKETVKTRRIKFNDEIKNITEYALYSATICAELPFVKEAYQELNRTNNFEVAAANLESNLDVIQESLKKNTNLFLKMHYHLPPAQSFVRSWTDKKGDKLDVFRKSVLHISKFQSSMAGIELGRPGLLLRGLAPIFDKNYKYLGSVDVSFPFNNVFNHFYTPENESLAIYLQVRNYSNYKNDTLLHRVGSYVFNNSTSNEFKTEFVNRQYFDKAINEGEAMFETANYLQYTFPIYDFQEEVVALAVLQIDKLKHNDLRTSMSIYLILMGLLFLIITLAFLYFLIKRYVSSPLVLISSSIQSILKGKSYTNLNFELDDDISIIGKNINQLSEYRAKVAGALASILKNEESTFDLTKFDKEDDLLLSLLSMNENISKVKELDSQRVKKEKVRKWTARGFSNFNKLLREHSDLEILADAVLKELINTLDANQGGIFIINEKDSQNLKFDLIASYAYDRKRFHNKEILFGEGLIGMCAIEKETMHLTELPDAYIELTSGLGQAVPSSLLLVPLMQDEKILGIIELASLNQFDEAKISFVEEVAKSISSSISMTSVNKQTQELLEETKFQAEQMSAQEEEMRQNMEELKATQEEMYKKEEIQTREIENLNIESEKKINELKQKELEMEGVFNALNTSTFLIEYDLKGNIIFVNDHVAKLFGKHKDQIIGKPQSSFVQYSDVQMNESRLMWRKLNEGKIVEAKHRLIINGSEIWLSETYTPIFDENGKPKKILKISHNITKEKNKEREIKETIEKIDRIKASQSRTIDKIVKRAERKELKLKNEILKLKEKK